MASSSEPLKVAGGTVAARVSAFQNAQKLEVSQPKVAEAGVTIGHGRRSDSDFGSPAGRASRDGNEGMKRDGRPPVNNATFELHESMKEKESYRIKLSRSNSRPTTSLDTQGTVRLGRNLRPHRSLEDIVSHSDSANEFLAAKSRLKPVGHAHKGPKREPEEDGASAPAAIRRRKTNSAVLEELDELLDSAIGEHTAQFTTTESNDTEEPEHRSPFARSKSMTAKSPSKATSRYSITAIRRRQSKPRDYPTESSADARDAQNKHVDAEVGINTEKDRKKDQILPLEVQKEPPRIEIPKSSQNSRSPIKARAALFEKLSQHEVDRVHEIPYVYDPRNPVGFKQLWPPKNNQKGEGTKQTTFEVSLLKHHEHFHHGVDETFAKTNPDYTLRSGSPREPRTAHVPPIPLALPQLVSHRRSTVSAVSSHTPSVTGSEPRVQPKSISISGPSIYATADEGASEPERKATLSWPFKWELFGKSPVAPVKPSHVAARAEPDHHNSTKKTHESQYRVHDLLTAVQDGRKTPASGGAEIEQQKSSTDVPGQQQSGEVGDEDKRKSSLMRKTPGALSETPRLSSFHEKEVATVAAKGEVPTCPESPGKSTHHTPVRGRRRTQGLEVIEVFSASNDSPVYAKEQRFTLSRSRSRGGGAVRVHVEVRSPRVSPERDTGAGVGDHVVIVSACVEPIDEEDEGGFGEVDGRGL